MKKAIIALLLAALLTGCAADVDQDTPDQSPSVSPDTAAEAPSPETETPSPSPLVSMEEAQAAYRDQGFGAVLAMLPQGYLAGIPREEIIHAHAGLNVGEQTYSVWLDWGTDTTVADAVALMEDTLDCAYELDEDTYKAQLADTGTSSVGRSEGGIQLSWELPVTGEADIAWLTDSFPLGYFELPDTLDALDAAQREVQPFFLGEMRTWQWEYSLTWEFDVAEGQALAGSLPAFYGDEDGYIQDQTGGDEVNIQWYEHDERFYIDIAYIYHEPSHMQSPLVREVLADPAASLLADLPEAYHGLLGQTSPNISVIYIPGDDQLCYALYSPAGADPAAFAAGAGAVLGGEFTDNGHGGYELSTPEVSAQIKPHDEELCLEIAIAAPADYRSPYIHDIYPSGYEPLDLDALLGAPHSVGTGYYPGNEHKSLEFLQVWHVDREQGLAACEEIEGALAGLHHFSGGAFDDGGAYGMRCAIREDYNFELRMEEKGEFWRLSIAFIAGIE